MLSDSDAGRIRGDLPRGTSRQRFSEHISREQAPKHEKIRSSEKKRMDGYRGKGLNKEGVDLCWKKEIKEIHLPKDSMRQRTCLIVAHKVVLHPKRKKSRACIGRQKL